MTKLDRLHITINSIIGFIGIVIGLIGIGVAPSIIVKILFALLFLAGSGWFIKNISHFLRRLPSPYHLSKFVTPPDFVGRETLLRNLNNSLKMTESLSLVGEQRMGKTSLLKTWQQQLQKTARQVVFVDGSQTAASLPALIDAITQQNCSDDPEQAATILKEWGLETATSTGLPPLLLIDEAEHFLEDIPLRFFERLRGMLQEGQLVILFVTSREINRIFADMEKTSPLSLRLLHLDLLEASSRDSLIARGHFNPQQIELIKTWAGSHPYYLQLLGQCLIEARQDGKNDEVALRHFQTNAAARFKKLQFNLTKKERQILQAACQSEQKIQQRSLIERGLVTEEGQLFGKVLLEWLIETGFEQD